MKLYIAPTFVWIFNFKDGVKTELDKKVINLKVKIIFR